MSVAHTLDRIASPTAKALGYLAPLADLLLRLYVAKVFWDSGMTKIANWQSTLFLFQYEYQVPLLPYEIAAYLGTAAELVLPVFLALGLAGRLSALALFAFNIVAVISYPGLNAAGQMQHLMWGLMLLMPMVHGPGKFSVDYLLRQRF
jgi:putative oxidoreductase